MAFDTFKYFPNFLFLGHAFVILSQLRLSDCGDCIIRAMYIFSHILDDGGSREKSKGGSLMFDEKWEGALKGDGCTTNPLQGEGR